MQQEIPLFISTIFIALTFALAGLIVFGVNATLNKINPSSTANLRVTGITALVIITWIGEMTFISSRNILDQWNSLPPRLMLILLPPLVVTIVLASSKKFGEFLKHVPQQWFVFIQSFRIIMEIILWWLFTKTIIPVQMTFEGRNFDIVAGLSALGIGYLVMRNKISNKMVIAWNIFGLVLLANIVIIAVLSAPFPFRAFMNEPANTFIAYFPFVWLPGFVVPVAYSMHIFSIKKALSK